MNWKKEPLVHFLAIGLLLFVVFGVVQRFGGSRSGEREPRIVISDAEIGWLRGTWELQWRRPPNEEELRRLIEDYVREEVLYREAVALGLDRDDTIVRRRLVQKMEFLSEDLEAHGEPQEADLQAFFDQDPEAYRVPTRLTFSHVYLSRDRRGERTQDDALQLLALLRADPDLDSRSLGDRFMLQRDYAAKSQTEIVQLFGRAFAERVFELEIGAWQGPVESGYGLHLVYVRDRIESRIPRLTEVRERVRNDLLTSRRREANRTFYERLRRRYEVEIDEAALSTGFAVAGGAPETSQ